MSKNTTRTCVLCGYYVGKPDTENVHLFNIPREEDRRQQWENILSRTLSKQNYLCEKHFNPEDIIKTKNKETGAELKPPRAWLKKAAVPQQCLNGEENSNSEELIVENATEKSLESRLADVTIPCGDTSESLHQESTITAVKEAEDVGKSLEKIAESQLPKNWYKIQPVTPQNCLVFANFVTKFTGPNFRTLPFKEILYVDGHIALNCLGKPISDDTLCGALQTEESLEFVIKQVDKLHVCCGIGPVAEIPNFDKVLTWQDCFDDWRDDKCLLLLSGRSQRCGYCHKFRENALKTSGAEKKKTVKIIVVRKKVTEVSST